MNTHDCIPFSKQPVQWNIASSKYVPPSSGIRANLFLKPILHIDDYLLIISYSSLQSTHSSTMETIAKFLSPTCPKKSWKAVLFYREYERDKHKRQDDLTACKLVSTNHQAILVVCETRETVSSTSPTYPYRWICRSQSFPRRATGLFF